VPRLLEEVAGALRMLELPQPAEYLTGIRRFTENELIARKRVPNGQQLDTLADALASIEYYLEALRDQRPSRDDILDIARQSLEALRYWPLPAQSADVEWAAPVVAEAGEADTNADAASAPTATAAAAPATPAVVVSAPTPPVAPAPVATGAVGGFEATGDEIDDEIREVFLEEFEEEIGHLEQMLPAGAPRRRTWKSCARSVASSTRSRAVAASSVRARSASSAGRSRTCSTACSTARARRARRWWRSSTMRSTRCLRCTPRCAAMRR
jgi:hypothetical protein